MDYLQYLHVTHPYHYYFMCVVLNLVINGLPSIPNKKDGLDTESLVLKGFKPCYKWITFNTTSLKLPPDKPIIIVLNLVINGLPSIPSSIDNLSNPISPVF